MNTCEIEQIIISWAKKNRLDVQNGAMNELMNALNLPAENDEAVRTVVQQRQQEIAFLDSLLNLDSTNGRCVLRHLLTKRKKQLLA